jgi:PEP-CTERM motif
MNRILSFGLPLVLLAAMCAPAQAIPALQIYIEGATYDNAEESWVLDASAMESVRIWTIGNLNGPGGVGTIFDVKLSVVYAEALQPFLEILLMPTQIGGLGVGEYDGTNDSINNPFHDPSVPIDPNAGQKSTFDGQLPKLGDGTDLPNHGQYNGDVRWQEFRLGDFDTADSEIGDFISSFPTPTATPKAQINAYDMVFLIDQAYTGPLDNLSFHLDLYDHYPTGNKIKFTFAPFSHDGTGTGPYRIVPEPSSMCLLGLGAFGLFAGKRARRLFRRRPDDGVASVA